MLRKHASLVIAMSLIALVATACILTTRRPPGQTSQPVMTEKHKEPKHEKHKDPHDNGHGHDDDHHH